MFKSKKTNKSAEKSSADIKKEKMAKTTDDPYVSRVLREIAARTVFGEIDGNKIYFSNYKLTVQAFIKKPEPMGSMFFCEMLFSVTHEYFDQPMEEGLAGVGINEEAALTAGAQMFVDGILEAVFDAFDADGESQIRNQIMGNMHVFRRTSTHETLCVGAAEPNMKDLWGIVKESIPLYLGTKRAYWLKLFASVSDGKYNCEARLNNIVYPELTQKLYKYVKGWRNKEQFHSEKQFFLFIQEDATYTPCNITREQVFDLTFKAIEIFKQVTDGDTRNKAVNTVRMLAKDENLAFDICTFLPEIYTQKLVNLKESDGIIAVKGEQQIPLVKSQLRVYTYIEDAVSRYIYHKKPTTEECMKIMALSSKMQAISEAVKNGGKIEDLLFPPMMFMINDDYEIR